MNTANLREYVSDTMLEIARNQIPKEKQKSKDYYQGLYDAFSHSALADKTTLVPPLRLQNDIILGALCNYIGIDVLKPSDLVYEKNNPHPKSQLWCWYRNSKNN